MMEATKLSAFQKEAVKEGDKLYFWFSSDFIINQLDYLFSFQKDKVRKKQLVINKLQQKKLLEIHPDNIEKKKGLYCLMLDELVLFEPIAHKPQNNIETEMYKFWLHYQLHQFNFSTKNDGDMNIIAKFLVKLKEVQKPGKKTSNVFLDVKGNIVYALKLSPEDNHTLFAWSYFLNNLETTYGGNIQKLSELYQSSDTLIKIIQAKKK
jgi:hypothetical protein